MLDLINLKIVLLKLHFVPWPIMFRRFLSVSFICAVSSQIMVGEAKKVRHSEPRRQGWEKSCVLTKEKAYETGDTETREQTSFSVPLATQAGKKCLKTSKGKCFD